MNKIISTNAIITPLPMGDGTTYIGTSLVTTTDLKEHINASEAKLKETQQLAESQIRVLRDTVYGDINNLRDKTSEDISDIQHALQSAITTSQKSETKLIAITDNIRNDINVLRDGLIMHNDALANLHIRLNTVLKCIGILGGVIILYTGYLIYRFL